MWSITQAADRSIEGAAVEQYRVHNGHAIMQRLRAAGCMLMHAAAVHRSQRQTTNSALFHILLQVRQIYGQARHVGT